MRQAMRTWRATTAGILELVAGALNLVAGVVVLLVSGALAAILELAGVPDISAATSLPIVLAIGIPLLLLGISALVGGICALRGRHWGFALFGAICSIPPFAGVLGIAAIVFVALAREEFQ